MNQSDLITWMSKRNGITKVQANEMLGMVLDALSHAMLHASRVRLKNIGTFNLRAQAARVGRNPNTGTAIRIPPRNTIKFRPSQALIRGVN